MQKPKQKYWKDPNYTDTGFFSGVQRLRYVSYALAIPVMLIALGDSIYNEITAKPIPAPVVVATTTQIQESSTTKLTSNNKTQ